MRTIACTEVWGGIGASDTTVELAGLRGVCWSRPYGGGARGGDIHFLSVCSSNRLSKAVLADVAGHGDVAAEAAEALHQGLAENRNEVDNVGLLQAVNQRLLLRNDPDLRFSTMVSVIYDSSEHSLVYAYAGHPDLLLGEAARRRFSPVSPEQGPRGGVPIGILRDVEYREHHIALADGDVIVLYSDAFTECRTPEGGFLGEEGLRRILDDTPEWSPRAIADHLIGTIGDRFDDDASLIALQAADDARRNATGA